MRARISETSSSPDRAFAEGDLETIVNLERYAGVTLDSASIESLSAAEPEDSAADVETIKERFLAEYFGTLTLAPAPTKVILDLIDFVVEAPDREGAS